MLTDLLERLAREILRVGVGSARLRDLDERGRGFGGAAEVEIAERDRVAGAEDEFLRALVLRRLVLARVRLHELPQHRDRLLLRAVARLVHRRDRAVERGFRRRAGLLGDGVELRGRGLELELAHQAVRVVHRRDGGGVVRRRGRSGLRR